MLPPYASPPPAAQDTLLSAYTYPLPEELIAQSPAARRDTSRLLILDRRSGDLHHTAFSELCRFLPSKSLLLANNVRVVPARLLGKRPSGGKMEFLLLTPLAEISPCQAAMHPNTALVQGLLRPASRARLGTIIEFAPNFSFCVTEIGDFGQTRGTLTWEGSLANLLQTHGHLPLPPYIRRPDNPEDAERYQTTYADPARAGAVAAPTAGLHFTPELRAQLAQEGHSWQELTLYVGYGTFSAVRSLDIRQHHMHREFVDIPEATAQAIREAKTEGRPIVAVGTTSARALEGAFEQCGDIRAFKGETGIFIYPGFEFKVVDHLITNFHLPGSTLLMLTAALAGREKILETYAAAVAHKYRFFSYGDAMLIL